jgi:hypothetical protein
MGTCAIFINPILQKTCAQNPPGLVVALWTGTLTYPQAFSALGNDTIWLILGAFFFAKASWRGLSLGPRAGRWGSRTADWGLGGAEGRVTR